MSTIASPRDPSTPLTRRITSSQAITTPTSSTRPSLDIPGSSATSSPNPNSSLPTITTTAPVPGPSKKANRAALREYYNLKKPPTPTVEISNAPNPPPSIDTLVSTSELDSPTFDAPSYISQTLSSSSLSDLLQTYARILSEIRALDAEKKALVYDNYSKLITATETIRRMRSTMDPLNPMAGTLDLVVARVYQLAGEAREGLLLSQTNKAQREGDEGRRQRTRELAREVLEVPARLRRLVDAGKQEEARREWEMPRRLLQRWREKELGGNEVEALIEEGDAIVRGGVRSESGMESGSESEASTT